MNKFPPIAIVGRACLLPGASSPEELWDAVSSGRDLIGSAPPDRWGVDPADVMPSDPDDSADRTWSDRGGYVSGFEQVFDPNGFSVPRDQVLALDPVFQWTLHTAREALRNSGHEDAEPSRMGAIFGNLSFPSAQMAAYTQATSIASQPGYGSEALDRADLTLPDPRNRFNSGLPALVLERALNLGVGAVALDAACASSLYAIKLACDRLHDGGADLMLAGAVNCADDLCIHMGFSALTALSRSGRSRPFNQEADGLVPAEGCAFVALRGLDDAVRDGDEIHGIIRGIGLSNDGRGRGMLVPSADGQARAISNAFESSGLTPQDVSLLECHATGTQVGDGVEIEATTSVYQRCEDLPIGSLKSNMGHLITAAGVAGLIKVVEAMKHEVRPPTLHAETPLESIAESPFRVLEKAERWHTDATGDGIRRAGLSAFGFGGNNAHLIVEEPSSANLLISQDLDSDIVCERQSPVAIVGIGVVAGSAVGRSNFADAVINDSPCLDDLGEGSMPDVSLLVKRQKFPPNDLRQTLPQQLALLQVADEALDDSGPLPGDTTGVFVGMGTDPEAARYGVRWRIADLGRKWGCSAEWIASARDAAGPALNAPGVLGTMPNIVANRLNSQFGLSGASFTVSSEERSGLDALEFAVRALRAGEIDAAMVGAVDLSCNPVHRAASATALAPDRHVPGDAAVMLILKRLDQAEEDGNIVYAVLPSGRFDESGDRLEDRPDMSMGLTDRAASVTHLFGHAHAAAGLVHVAAATVVLHRRVSPCHAPLLASNPESGSGFSPGVGPRTVSVEIDAMEGIVRKSVLLAEATSHMSPALSVAPRLHIFSGGSANEVLQRLASGRESTEGPARLVIVAAGDEQYATRSDRARRHVEDGHPPGAGVHFRSEPLKGDLAFVFSAAGSGYKGMGSELFNALPEIVTPLCENFPVRTLARWVFEGGGPKPSPSDFLWGTSLLSQAHARLSSDLLRIRPTAAIGYSSGETSSLFAFGIWSDMDQMRREIESSGLMERELGGDFDAVARAWGVPSANWSVWNVSAALEDVRSALAAEPRVHLAIINTAHDVVIAGDSAGCDRVVELLGQNRCLPVEYDLACHTPELAAEFHDQWLGIHTRSVTDGSGVRFYSNGANAAYEVSKKSCANAITRQAESTLDFPATIEAAYADGVRIFVEHGPGMACTGYIREVLDGHDVLAVHLDRRGKGVEQIFEVAAALVAAGVEVDHVALSQRLSLQNEPVRSSDGPVLTFPSHAAPLRLPPLPACSVLSEQQTMAPAPELPSVFATALVQRPTTLAATIERQMTDMAQLHERFVKQQQSAHQQFLEIRQTTLAQIPLGPEVTGPTWDREQLKIHSSGKISDLFGPMFEPQDASRIQCRMPEPPLLLADRVTGLLAEPGVLGQGTIWTETDVAPNAWYLNDGYMPAGFMIEAGQADLMLISYMGIDLLNDEQRAYRLLGCTLTYHGDLPSADDTLQYEIRITGHAKHGDIRLFFFEYDCTVDGEQRLTVRDAQAGFFTKDELSNALGVLWDPKDERLQLADDARTDAPEVECTKSSFSDDDLIAYSEGRVLDCFGPGFEWTETHTRTPKIQSSEQLFIDRVSTFDPTGGPWGRGFMRCETSIAEDAWFFEGHFKNDPCMPGNFMVEACVEALSFYLTALGYTTRRDGWRFQPLAEQPFDLKCRGEINPQSDRVVYEVHVEEVWSGPHPTIICDVVGFVDGHAAFHAHRLGVELVPDWPLTSMPEIVVGDAQDCVVAKGENGFPFDWKAMISCAWGRPSEAFGPMYQMFDGIRRPPRLPGPPYHFMSRVLSIEGNLNDLQAGMEIVCEYDIPDDAWYFDASGSERMPFAVLLEAALQPCGWVASAVGSVTEFDEDLLFRNLDGTATVTEDLTRTAGSLLTRVKLKTVSRAGGMIIEGFDVECSLGDRPVFTMDTVFGFFPLDAFENQVGLPQGPNSDIDVPAGQMVDLRERPAMYCNGELRLADPTLLMLDRAERIAGRAGQGQGLGVVRGEKDISVSEWFFKAHFFQDPVQPGSLGIEALLQLLQFFMLDTNMSAGITAPRFESLMNRTPMTWKYRGQVTPDNKLITTVMEITEVGTDDLGPFVVGKGSLWCDGLRIYEVENMGMRIVSDAPSQSVVTSPGYSLGAAVRVSRGSHPQLADHALNGTPVVPAAYVAEWFARVARDHSPSMHLKEIGKLKILKGVALDDYMDGADCDLRVLVKTLDKSLSETVLSLQLTDPDTGRLRYGCTATLSLDPPDTDSDSATLDMTRDGSSEQMRSVYDGGVLFHRSSFEVLDSVELSRTVGLTALIGGVEDRDWPTEPRVLDPAVLDGAIQLALLWTEHLLGRASLPTRIGSIRWYQAPLHGRVFARLTGQKATKNRVLCDVVLCDTGGIIVAEIAGIETHCLSGTTEQ